MDSNSMETSNDLQPTMFCRWSPANIETSDDTVASYLKRMYRHDRLEGRNGPTWGHDYSARVIRGSEEQLALCGWLCVSPHEAVDGQVHFWRPA